MSYLIAIVCGTLLGTVGLFPGLHFSMVLLMIGPWILSQFELAEGILAMVSAVMVARCMHTLAVVYHPVSGDNLASADPAQRMAARGQGKYATKLLGESLWTSTKFIAFGLGLCMLYNQIFHEDIIKGAMKMASFISIPAILFWIVFTIQKSRRKIGTVLVMLASAVLGVVALNAPAVEGSHHAMTPLLTGIFAFPVLLLTLLEKHSSSKKIQLEKEPEQEHHEDIKWLGILIGLTSVVLPGIGTSSLTSLAQDMTESEGEYLTVAGFAEATGEVLALTLGILGLASRSSDAAVIQKIMEVHASEVQIDPAFGFILLAVLLLACYLGMKLTGFLSMPYRFMLNLVPVKLQALGVAISMIWVVWIHTSWWGIGIVAAGTLVHFGAREYRTSNQAFFACMVGPLLLSMLGIKLF